MKQWFIPGNVPSSKNSKRIVSKKLPSGKSLPFLIDSELAASYKKTHSILYRSMRSDFKKETSIFSGPAYIGFYFVRDSHRDFDYHNAVQIVADIMVKELVMEDDNARIFVPVFLGYTVDKNKAGVYVRVLSEVYEKQMKVYNDHFKNIMYPVLFKAEQFKAKKKQNVADTRSKAA